MKRWTYLVPRLIIVALIGLVVWLSIDSLARHALVANAEALTGAKVDVGQLKLNLKEGKVFLQEVQFADPRNTDLNLFQADMAYLDVDLSALLRKKIKITGGRTSDLSFGSPRTRSGQLASNRNERAGSSAGAEDLATERKPKQTTATTRALVTDESESRWLDQLQEQIVTHDAPVSSSQTTIKDMAEQWPPRLAEAGQSLSEIKQQINQLKESFKDQDSNPLRQDFNDAKSELASLLRQTMAVQNDLVKLHAQAAADKEKLTTAQLADRRAIEQLASIQSFDGETISQLLLVRSQTERVNEIVRWFRWFRQAVPDCERDFHPELSRGQNVAIPPKDGTTVQPDFLIENLEIEGAGHFQGQFLNFAGTLSNLSSQPKFHSEPTSFDLRAQGKHHFVVRCELDRRTGSPVDTLEVKCPDLQIDHGPLGSDRSILVTVGPNIRLQSDVRLKAIGDSLAGDLIFRHSNVSLHVDQLSSLAGGTEMALRLNQELSACNQFETRISLSGTMDQYNIEIESDLGNQFAKSMNTVSKEIQRQQLASRKKRWKETIERQAADLTSQIDAALETLDADTKNASAWLEQTGENISSTANAAWPAIR